MAPKWRPKKGSFVSDELLNEQLKIARRTNHSKNEIAIMIHVVVFCLVILLCIVQIVVGKL